MHVCVFLYVLHICAGTLGVSCLMQYPQTCNNNTHKHTPTLWHCTKEKGKFSFNEVNNTWHILTFFFFFYYTLPLFVTTSPQFSLLREAEHEWRKAQMQTHTHIHTNVVGEREGQERAATRKRKVHVSLILLWCNIDISMEAPSGTAGTLCWVHFLYKYTPYQQGWRGVWGR